MDRAGGGAGGGGGRQAPPLFVEKILNLAQYISKTEKNFHGITVVD